MKESEFIEQNKKKWLEFENNLLKKDADPSLTSKLFVQVTDDLSYARTFYKNRSVKVYLNGTARVLFNHLNKSQKRGWRAFINFWKKDLPLTLYDTRRALLISLVIFVACFTLGVITSIYDKDFAKSILSNGYVQMTNENIAKGDPMAVYKSESELRTFFPILYNNLRVNFLTFFSGIFMAIGSLVVMVINGVMVGVFQYFFIERDVFWESFLGIWTHGALEIPTIILSGGAGLTLGKGLLFPGTYTRFQAFRISGMKGLKIIMGVSPVIVLAAFIESFLTRHTDIPDVLRLAFILVSFSFIIIYFYWYPRRVAVLGRADTGSANSILVHEQEGVFDASHIYTVQKLVTETFRLFFKRPGVLIKPLLFMALTSSVLITLNPLNLFCGYDTFSFGPGDFFNYSAFPAMGILNLISIIVLMYTFTRSTKSELIVEQHTESFLVPDFLKTGYTLFLSSLLFSFIIFTDVDFTTTAAQVLLPFFIFVTCVSLYQNKTFKQAFLFSGTLLAQSWSRFIVPAVIFFGVGFLFYYTSSKAIDLLLIKKAIVWVLTDDETTARRIAMGLYVFQTYVSFFLYLALLVICNSLLMFTLKEIHSAERLIAKIESTPILK